MKCTDMRTMTTQDTGKKVNSVVLATVLRTGARKAKLHTTYRTESRICCKIPVGIKSTRVFRFTFEGGGVETDRKHGDRRLSCSHGFVHNFLNRGLSVRLQEGTVPNSYPSSRRQASILLWNCCFGAVLWHLDGTRNLRVAFPCITIPAWPSRSNSRSSGRIGGPPIGGMTNLPVRGKAGTRRKF